MSKFRHRVLNCSMPAGEYNNILYMKSKTADTQIITGEVLTSQHQALWFVMQL